MTRKILFAYIVFIFLLTGIAPLFPTKAAITYVSVAILLGGLVAIVLQKTVHRGKFVDMGFRLNRNALIGEIFPNVVDDLMIRRRTRISRGS